jgi:hypothetical protein
MLNTRVMSTPMEIAAASAGSTVGRSGSIVPVPGSATATSTTKITAMTSPRISPSMM